MPRFQIPIRHDGLGKSRVITGSDQLTVINKIEQQHAEWENEWLARLRTEEAKEEIQSVQSILAAAIASGDSLKSSDAFPEAPPPPPAGETLAAEPQPTDPAFRSVIAGRVDRGKFARAHEGWLKQKLRIDAERDAYSQDVAGWEDRKRQFRNLQQWKNGTPAQVWQIFDSAIPEYERGNLSFIASIIERILAEYSWRSHWEISLHPEHRAIFVSQNRTLIIDYSLPTISDIPDLKE